MNKYFTYLLTALLACFAAVSCVKDQDRLFDESSSAHMTKYLDEAQKVLMGASNGWVMYYYPNGPGAPRAAQNIGGYVYTLTFTKDEVTVWSELGSDSSVSLYSMSTDDGPVLNFDTFNENFHYFSTPSGSSPNIYGLSGGTYYQAHKGDFNFRIMEATPEKVVLRGKRSGNDYIMYPLSGSMSPAQYAAASAEMSSEIFVSKFVGKFASKDVEFLLDLKNRQMKLQEVEYVTTEDEDGNPVKETNVLEEVSTALAYTPEGIRFYHPVTFAGVEFQTLAWDGAKASLSYNGDVLAGSLPENWLSYEDLLGDYTLYYYETNAAYADKTVSTLDISLVEDVYRNSFKVIGICNEHELIAPYDLSAGTVSLLAQKVGTEVIDGASYYYQLAGYACAAGYVTYDAAFGMTGTWKTGTEPKEIYFKDNGGWKSYQCTGYILYQFTSAGTRVGRIDSGEWSLKTGNGYLRYVEKIVKK